MKYDVIIPKQQHCPQNFIKAWISLIFSYKTMKIARTTNSDILIPFLDSELRKVFLYSW